MKLDMATGHAMLISIVYMLIINTGSHREIRGPGANFNSGLLHLKKKFKKYFRTNSCKITGKTHFFGPNTSKIKV